MWIRNVNLPASLVHAHRTGELILFVGAGASMDSPADLPSFVQMTRRVAADARITLTDEDLAVPDRALDRMDGQDVDVHQIIRTMISRPDSQPNDLHRALARLATAQTPPRVVTTNYDPHLSTAIHDHGVKVAEYCGPALPVGDDFDGIVYLHGAVTQEPRWLVATEADFGRAYLTDAWAARFVERMFATYTVLFVGYSHNDTVMRMMARALGGKGKKRYALTSDPNREVWQTYGVLPIEYKVVERSHAALAEAIEGWAAWASMGLYDHRQRVARLVAPPRPALPVSDAAPPRSQSLVPEDQSYLEDVLADPDRVRFFTELADGTEWLSWAAQQPHFQAMFDPAAPDDPCTRRLADWFVERFVMNQALATDALRVAHSSGGRPAPVLCDRLGLNLHRGPAPRPPWLGAWLMLLIEHAGENHTDWLEYALLKSRLPEDREAALLLFDTLTEPRLRQRALGIEPSFEVQVRGSADGLAEAWSTVFRPALAEVAAAVLVVAERQLRRMFAQLWVARSAQPSWDPVSIGRYAIEQHQGDRYREPADVIIDAARDCIEELLRSGAPAGPGYLENWTTSEVPILRRLAVHGWRVRSDVTAGAKTSWLRERGWLFEHELRPEVFGLIRDALPHASAADADALVADATSSPLAGPDDEHVAYMRFNALVWMTRWAPQLRSARTALDAVKTNYPHFEPRTAPDLLRSRIEVGVRSDQPPMTTDELHARIEAGASAAVTELRRYEGVDFALNQPSWGDALGVLTATVRAHPQDGFTVLDAVDGGSTDLMGAVINGWSSATLDPDTAAAVIDRLHTVDLASPADSVARLLIGGLGQNPHATEWHLLPQARSLAESLWTVLPAAPATNEVRDWMTRAINHPAGYLTEFWIRAISADWTASGDSWTGLPTDLRRPIENILAGADTRTWLAQVILANHLAFFFAADQAWCEAHLLPLMDWKTGHDRACRCWHGYLYSGRIGPLFEAGLRDGYLDAVSHAAGLPDDLRRALSDHLAVIAFYGESHPLSWAEDFTRRAGKQQRVEWITHIAQMLDSLDAPTIEQQWQRWMAQYWRRRTESKPIKLTDDEASALTTWIIHLSESLAEGVALATTHPASLTKRRSLNDWPDERLAEAPRLFAKLLAHLLRYTEAPIREDVARVALVVRDGADPADLTTIRNEGLRLGIHGAEDW